MAVSPFHFLSDYCLPAPALNPWGAFSPLIIKTNLWGAAYFYSHLTDKK